ncbi:alanine--tRNA ligase [Patescibacteria group bacterium]|nr:alanine--tRNA ligase [Patescibacteria group bacterium]MDE1946580.1 alanine--tRNA ligase [Patescibacteria group bacterium]MDE2010859.1 alanine--tRNA ligase [Patescibacteria group bacterium]MDE2233207.1 alanine--tRNA ligase [Patescibacteria group bacterium]
MTSSEIRTRFLEFFKKRGHTIIPSASLVTSDEKGVTNPTLFNTAGMQPLIPYLLGKPFLDNDGKEIKRLADAQKCLRTVDIDEVGDTVHATFFEMLGNWSLGDYFKKEAINWSYEFLTSKEEGLGLDPKRLYITVFEGDGNAPRDDEAAEIWASTLGLSTTATSRSPTSAVGRIFFMSADKNWWEAGNDGPCGPDSEMYYDVANRFGGREIAQEEFVDADEKKDLVEVWNDVFMQYEKKDGKIIGKLPKPSVDTGAGLERLAMTLQKVDNIYDIDLLKPVMEKIKELSKNWDIKSARIFADHIRASVFLTADGVIPGNTDRGYVLRRLIRRFVRHADTLGINQNAAASVFGKIIDVYADTYDDLKKQDKNIRSVLVAEETKYRETANKGFHELRRRLKDKGTFSTNDLFDFYQSYGLSKEQLKETLSELPIKFDEKDFDDLVKNHQALSRAGAEKKFKGGLADANDPMVVRYHTATHLLHQALHDILGNEVSQKGSNITPERLRFDFSYPSKMTDEQKKKVEEIVNEKIALKLTVNQVVMPSEEAVKTGAYHFFNEKYPEQVSVYYIGDDIDHAYSKEFCGGPHVANTGELAGPEGKWKFKLKKEEAVAQGVRRIRAVLE